MGFKVTVRKNGATHGESHYPAEALAVGAAQKMRNAGAGAGVATTVERCNPGCLGCNGMKSNPKSKSKEPPVWEREGHSQRNPRRNGKAKRVGIDDTVQFGEIAFYSSTPKRVIVQRKMSNGMREQPGYAYRGYYLVQEHTPKSFAESGPLVPRAGGRWTVLHESGLSVVFNAPTLKGAQAVVDGLRETEGGRAIATTPANDVMQYEKDVKRLYGRSFTRNRRNGAAKTETFAVARKRIFNEFGAAGWKLSSPTLLVLHATSPDGRTRAWFKPQAVYYTTVGKGQRHDAGDGHTVSYSLDIRTVPPGVFVPWFIKNFDK